MRTHLSLSIASAVILAGSVALPAPSFGAPVRQPEKPSTAQAALDAALDVRPGGVQVSDNAVSWDGGNVILVVPSPGQKVAPPGLGYGVRENTLSTPLLEEQAEIGDQAQRGRVLRRGSAGTCPGGYFETDYYCFYVDRDYEGRRLQFTGNTEAGDASQWGFNNSVSSWVSNDVDCTVKAYNPKEPMDLSNYMWRQPENSTSTYVGSAHNDKMTFWNCH